MPCIINKKIMKLLEGKVAVITGAARGIGKAIALKFASEGADIAFTDLAIDEIGKATEQEIAALGVRAKGYASNAANFEEAHNVVAEIVKDFGRIDILVNNAGITRDGLMMRMTEQQWDMVINVNLKSAFNFIHAVTPIMMRQKGGSIINMASVVGVSGNAGQCNYSASKAGMIGLAKSIAKGLYRMRYSPFLFLLGGWPGAARCGGRGVAGRPLKRPYLPAALTPPPPITLLMRCSSVSYRRPQLRFQLTLTATICLIMFVVITW